MIVHNVTQGSEDWHRARAGLVTGSMFKVARQKLKNGQPSAAAKDYAFRVAVESISGLPMDEGYTTWAMQRGIEMEPDARAAHEIHAGITVETCGFVITDCGRFGASADGLIGDDGGAEYKCLVSPERIRDAILYNDLSEWMDQCQGGMWITERAFWDFCIYCPALDGVGKAFNRWRIQRDDDYIAALRDDLEDFYRLVLDYRTALAQPIAA